jgi:hypothetical protein
MQHARNEETRRRMDVANASRCIHANTPLLEETLALRQGTMKVCARVRVRVPRLTHVRRGCAVAGI